MKFITYRTESPAGSTALLVLDFCNGSQFPPVDGAVYLDILRLYEPAASPLVVGWNLEPVSARNNLLSGLKIKTTKIYD